MEDKGQDVRSDIICEPSVDTNIRSEVRTCLCSSLHYALLMKNTVENSNEENSHVENRKKC